MQNSGYDLITLDGKSQASFDGETLRMPAFEGMLALVRQE